MKSLLLKSFDLLNLYPLFNRYTANTATVFMLHSVVPDGEDTSGGISVSRLRGFLEYLKTASYNVTSLADHVAAIRGHRTTYKTVVFTVDDGYRSFYLNCYPLFREYGYPATVFLTSDFIEKRIFLWWDKIEFAINSTSHTGIDLTEAGLGRVEFITDQQKANVAYLITEHCKRLTQNERLALVEHVVAALEVDISDQPLGKYEPLQWQEIDEMSRHGIDFYPHTRTHPILSSLSYEQKLAEVAQCKEFLEGKLNRTLDIFAYPNGKMEDIDADTITALRESGYTVALTTMPGFNNTRINNNLFMLHRFAIPDSPQWFKQYVSGLEFVKGRLRRLESIKPFS
jgi:peptidoglycan/xylan/chitin deacetylase (PgdA/CDA1 family)